MQVIGFNFTKITAERSQKVKETTLVNTDIEFIEIEKDTVPTLNDLETINVSFRFVVSYKESEKKETKEGQVLFEGRVMLTAEKEAAKDLLKSWKKKELPVSIKVPLFNLILKKCTAKALDLEEQINLPAHIRIPQIRAKSKE